MCGIAGYIHFKGHNPEEEAVRIKKMTDTLVHRGPDDEGYFIDHHAALGHRRLSIIDRKGGLQPMKRSLDSLYIVFNGEIYNFLEIRNELLSKGYEFATWSDTEVLLASYAEWGEDCVKKLNGMFAFAIWNSRKKSIFLGRDRVGKKPLYYYSDGNVFSFASELKALIAGGFCSDSINPRALDCYFCFGYVPASHVIFKSVKKLQAAHTLLVNSKNFELKRYWRLSCSPVSRRHGSLEEAAEEFEDLFDRAVACRMMSDVPLGAFLSGGIDSALVVSSMAKRMNDKVLTNTIGFDDKTFNELPIARSVAEFFCCDHREFVVQSDVSDVIDRISCYFDEPFADSSAVPTWYACQMAKQNVTVVLSGDGGDESFGGYTFRYLPHMLESKIRTFFPFFFRKMVFGGLGAVYPNSSRLPKMMRLKTILNNLAVDDAEAFYRDLVWLLPEERKKLYSPGFLDSLQNFTPLDTVSWFYNDNDAVTAMSRGQYADIHFYMTDDVLVKVDRMSMAHSLEVRSPLLDYRILEFAAKLPTRLKINSTRGKLVLRYLASKRMPSQVNKQPKRGFSIPAADWLRVELRECVEQALNSKRSLIHTIFNSEELNRLWYRHVKGRKDYNVFFWGLIMLYKWEEKFNTHVFELNHD